MTKAEPLSTTRPWELTEDDRLVRGSRVLDPPRWAWREAPVGAARTVLCPHEALLAVARRHALRHLVVAMIGPREATPAQEAAAEAVARGLAPLGVTMICGGKSGVMEAACRGFAAAGGAPVGILPDHGPEGANPYVAIPLPTGLSEGRNMVIAKAARVLIAVGGSYGTLSEVAYGLHFAKPVIGLENAPEVDGVQHVETPAAALREVSAALIRQVS
jgi:hypothetical protein